MDAYTLLSSLERFLQERGIEVAGLTADPMLALMFDWHRLVKVDKMEQVPLSDALVYRYGGWSEGCATGFRFSVLRRVTQQGEQGPVSFNAGVTLMFDPGKLGHLQPLSVASTDHESLERFLEAIEDSPAYKQLSSATPMGAMLEMGALR